MYILMYSAIQKLPTTSTAALSFIYPAVAILLDLLVYGHRMDMAQIAGVALIFLAAAGVSLNWSWRRRAAAPATAPLRSGSHNRAPPVVGRGPARPRYPFPPAGHHRRRRADRKGHPP